MLGSEQGNLSAPKRQFTGTAPGFGSYSSESASYTSSEPSERGAVSDCGASTSSRQIVPPAACSCSCSGRAWPAMSAIGSFGRAVSEKQTVGFLVGVGELSVAEAGQDR